MNLRSCYIMEISNQFVVTKSGLTLAEAMSYASESQYLRFNNSGAVNLAYTRAEIKDKTFDYSESVNANWEVGSFEVVVNEALILSKVRNSISLNRVSELAEKAHYSLNYLIRYYLNKPETEIPELNVALKVLEVIKDKI